LRLWPIVLMAVSAAACQQGVPAGLNEDLGFSDLVFVNRTPPRHAGSLVAGDGFRPGGNLVMLSPAAPGGKLTNLSGLAAGDVAGVDVSPDGKSALAAIRTDPHDRFHIYRLDFAAAKRGDQCFTDKGDVGPACTRLTFGPADDTGPFHLADGRIAFLREDPRGQVDFEGRGRSRTLYAVAPDTADLVRLDYGPGHDLGAGSLSDGRIRLVRWTRRESQAVFVPLVADPSGSAGIVPDGGELSAVPLTPRQDAQARQFAACTPPFGTWGAGTLCQRDDAGEWVTSVANIPAGDGCSPLGRVRDPYPLSDGRFLASIATTPQGCTNTEDGDRGLVPRYSVAILDPQDGGRLPLYGRSNAADLFPRPVMEHALLDEGLAPPAPPGACQEGGVVFEGFARDENGPVDGAARLRLLEGLSGEIAPWMMEIGGRDVGALCGSGGVFEAPLYPDSSFNVRAPAGVPIRIQLLDHYGAALGSDPLWRGGPACASRSCSGCHAGAAASGEVEHSLAHAADPIDFADRSTERSIDFARDIQPILNRSCATAGCHDSVTAAGNYVNLAGALQGLDLSATPAGRTSNAYRSLTMVDTRRDAGGRILESRSPYVVPGSARQSRLIERLGVPCRFDCAGQPGWAAWALGEGQTHPEDQPGFSGVLSDEERWLIVEWIDAGAPFLGRGATP